MGFYSNTNTTKVVRAAVTTDEIWDLYKKAKAESITRERNNLPGVVFYPEIKIGRESNSSFTFHRLRLLENVASSGSFKYLKRFLLPREITDEESKDLIEDLSEHYKDCEYCNKAIIRWYLEKSYAVCVVCGDVNLHEHIFILDKKGEVLKIHT